MWPSSKSCSASSRIVCQLSASGSSSGNDATSTNGRFGTAEKQYMMRVVRRQERRVVGELAVEPVPHAAAEMHEHRPRDEPVEDHRLPASSAARRSDAVMPMRAGDPARCPRHCVHVSSVRGPCGPPLRVFLATAFQRRCTQYHCSGWRRTSPFEDRVVGARVQADGLAGVLALDRRDRRPRSAARGGRRARASSWPAPPARRWRAR